MTGTAAGAPGGHEGDHAMKGGGTAVALTAVPASKGRNHEKGQHLELSQWETRGGGGTLPSPLGSLRWFV
jgi:hypothetical protein